MVSSGRLFGFLLAIILVTGVGLARDDPYGNRDTAYREGYNRGYDIGSRRGSDDSRRGARYDLNSREYRDADAGYDRSLRYKDDYKRGFRSGYETGYRNAYNGNGYGRRSNRDPYYGRYPGNDRAYRRPFPDPYGYPNNGGYGSYPRAGVGGAYEAAADRGYRDGVNKGREDYNKHRSFDPARHDDYRDADKGYKSSYGDKRDYQAGYRRAFEQGYREGFRRS